MIEYDILRARKAVQFLVDSPYTANHVKKLRAAVAKPRAMPFKGEAAVLNELLVIGRQSLQAMENLIEVAEYKRDDRNEYQRQFMAAKRRRDRKVIRLEELMLGKTLSLDERTKLLHRQYEIWKDEKHRVMDAVHDLPWASRNKAIREFWDKKEHEFDELLEEAEKQLDKIVHRKRVVQVAPAKETVLGSKLKEVLKPAPKRKVSLDKSK